MNLSLLQPTHTSTWHIVLETLDLGQISARVAEFSECRVVAKSQEAAISALEVLLNKRLATIKVLPLQLSSENSESSWANLYGSLKDNSSFIKWSDRFWAEKQHNSEEEDILPVDESLRVI
jgi:hypothetical protein